MKDLVEVGFRNFMSFGNNMTVVPLNNPGTTHIVGENLDQGGSSGSGKSTIISAILYALFDKTLNQIGKERLINKTNQTKNTQMEVYLLFRRDKDEYKIRRYRGESYGVQIIKNGDDITPDSVSNINRKIEEIVGFSFELFSRTVVFNGNDKPFLDLPISEQRAQIEELLKLKTLTDKAVALKEEMRELEGEVKVKQAVLKQQQTAYELHVKHLADAKNRIEKWESDKQKNINTINESISILSNVDVDTEIEYLTKIEQLTPDVNSLSKNIKIVEKQISLLNNDASKYESNLVHLLESKCPFCLQKIADADLKIEELQSTLEKIKAEIITATSEYDKLLKDYQSKYAELSELKSKASFNSLAEAHSIHSEMIALESKLKDIISSKNPHIDALNTLSADKIELPDESEIDEMNIKIENQKFLHKLLTDKNSFLRKGFINKSMPFLNKQLAYYTNALNLPHVVKFNADMSCEISEYGRDLDFGNLSNGEKKRLNLALSFAFRDVLSHLHEPINILFADEVDGGSFDSNIVDMSISLFKQKSRADKCSIYIISHRPEFEGNLDNTITIVKENGFSNVQ